MGDLLVIAALIVIGAIVLVVKGTYYLLRAGYRELSGDAEREEERKQRLSAAKAQFERALLNRQFPSEYVLGMLADSDSFRDIDGNYESDLIPERLFQRYGYRCSYPEAVKRIRDEKQADEERHRTTTEYANVVQRFAALSTACAKPWDEIMRTMRAMGGNGFEAQPIATAVEYDTLQVLAALSIANGGSVPDGIGRLCQAVLSAINPGLYLTIEDCIRVIRNTERRPVALPGAVKVISGYPTMLRTPTSAHTAVASAYWSLISTASDCASSAPAAAVAAMYFGLLRPFMGDGYGSGSASGNGAGNRSWTCAMCARYYPVLRLQSDASEEEIKAARRDLAQIYHPDRFHGKSERLRRMAEEALKEVNAAFDHVLSHFETARQTA